MERPQTVTIDLRELYEETAAQLREAEFAVATLRGQLQILTRIMQEAQRPILSGDPLSDRPKEQQP